MWLLLFDTRHGPGRQRRRSRHRHGRFVGGFPGMLRCLRIGLNGQRRCRSCRRPSFRLKVKVVFVVSSTGCRRRRKSVGRNGRGNGSRRHCLRQAVIQSELSCCCCCRFANQQKQCAKEFFPHNTCNGDKSDRRCYYRYRLEGCQVVVVLQRLLTHTQQAKCFSLLEETK